MRVEGERRYALLLAARDSDYVRKVYGGYFNVFVEAFGDDGDRWDLFRVVDGEFPDAADLRKYHGFVVSGSPHDAYADDLWILRLCLLLQTLHSMRKRVLGICFGHQVLCRALGGRVGKASGGWNIGIREVRMAEALPACRFLDGSRETQSASIVKIHRDEVLEVPGGARVLASSDQTSVEAFCVGDHALGIQGHPEYTKDILRTPQPRRPPRRPQLHRARLRGGREGEVGGGGAGQAVLAEGVQGLPQRTVAGGAAADGGSRDLHGKSPTFLY